MSLATAFEVLGGGSGPRNQKIQITLPGECISDLAIVLASKDEEQVMSILEKHCRYIKSTVARTSTWARSDVFRSSLYTNGITSEETYHQRYPDSTLWSGLKAEKAGERFKWKKGYLLLSWVSDATNFLLEDGNTRVDIFEMEKWSDEFVFGMLLPVNCPPEVVHFLASRRQNIAASFRPLDASGCDQVNFLGSIARPQNFEYYLSLTPSKQKLTILGVGGDEFRIRHVLDKAHRKNPLTFPKPREEGGQRPTEVVYVNITKFIE